MPEADKLALRFLLNLPFGIFGYFFCVASLGTWIYSNVNDNQMIKEFLHVKRSHIFLDTQLQLQTISTGQTRCLQSVNYVCVSPHQEWVGKIDDWSFVVRQNNYIFHANHDTKFTDDM